MNSLSCSSPTDTDNLPLPRICNKISNNTNIKRHIMITLLGPLSLERPPLNQGSFPLNFHSANSGFRKIICNWKANLLAPHFLQLDLWNELQTVSNWPNCHQVPLRLYQEHKECLNNREIYLENHFQFQKFWSFPLEVLFLFILVLIDLLVDLCL